MRPRSARPASDLHELKSEHKYSTSCTQTEQSYFGNVEVCEKASEPKQKKISTDLHPIYISALLILVGFNFSAFITTYESTIKGIKTTIWYILLERKCVREDAKVGDNVIIYSGLKPMSHTIFNVTAYAYTHFVS